MSTAINRARPFSRRAGHDRRGLRRRVQGPLGQERGAVIAHGTPHRPEIVPQGSLDQAGQCFAVLRGTCLGFANQAVIEVQGRLHTEIWTLAASRINVLDDTADTFPSPRSWHALVAPSQFSLAWLRQKGNQYMACPPELARTFPPRLQELIGYDLGAVNLGFVDHKHPNEVLNGTAGDGPGDLGPEALQRREERTNKLRVASWAPMNRKRVRLDADVVQGGG